jgi:asparagine synthetase B (glutamine-hydrolysing)
VLGFSAWGTVPPSLTCVAGVDSLSPGSWLRWSQDGNCVRQHVRGRRRRVRADAVGLQRSRAARARSARPCSRAWARTWSPTCRSALFLSGGIDSSAILSAAVDRRHALNTYTVRFDDRSSSTSTRGWCASLRRDPPRAASSILADRHATCRGSWRGSINRRSTP